MSFIVTSMSEVNTASDNRLYYVIGARDVLPNGLFNPFQREAKRVVWQQYQRDADGAIITDDNGDKLSEWVIGHPKLVKPLVGKVPVTGDIVTMAVEPYTIPGVDKDGNKMDRVVNTYTTIVFPRENVETVFRNAGHPIISETDASEEVTANAPAETEPKLVQ